LDVRDNVAKFMKSDPFHVAGILFGLNREGASDVHLFRRVIVPDAGAWSVVGGLCEDGEIPA